MLETMTETEYVTATVGGQLFGLPIARVQDVFVLDRLTRVPLAAPEIAGVLNLRGRIVTAIDMRRRLGLAPAGEVRRRMAIGIEYKGESYGLLIDAIGEVLNLPTAGREGNPVNLEPGSRACRRAFIGWRTGSWWCSTSTACSMSASRRRRHEFATPWKYQMNRGNGRVPPHNEERLQ
jgi:purine-binding chemotaxis protein CheW